jgi:hypothetical protein
LASGLSAMVESPIIKKTTFFSGDINPTKIIAANKYTILFICVDCEAFLVAQDYSNNDEK